MNKIFKYQLEVTDNQVIQMPENAEILTVQVQNIDLKQVPCLWARVNPDYIKRPYKIRTIGTGHPIEDDFNGKYLGTYQLTELSEILVFHVFLKV
jgi:hypothetical protein